MAKPKRDPVREERIHEEIIVDAYGPEEQAMGWYYYLEDKIHFPFQAKCIASKVTSPLRKGESVEVQGSGARRHLLRRHARADPVAGPHHGCPALPTNCHRPG